MMFNPYGVDPSRFTLIPRVLIIATRGEDVLMLKRAEHKRLWPGLYNAPGGHVEQGETPIEAAARELTEETGLHADTLTLRGVLIGDAVANLPGVLVFIYHAQVTGQLHAHNEEGTPHWIPRDQLPHIPILPDLPLILRHVLEEDAFFYIYKTPGEKTQETIRVVVSPSSNDDNAPSS